MTEKRLRRITFAIRSTALVAALLDLLVLLPWALWACGGPSRAYQELAGGFWLEWWRGGSILWLGSPCAGVALLIARRSNARSLALGFATAVSAAMALQAIDILSDFIDAIDFGACASRGLAGSLMATGLWLWAFVIMLPGMLIPLISLVGALGLVVSPSLRGGCSCARCGYLRGGGDWSVCPECGESWPAPTSQSP